ncbi:hypothetical protein CALVIDRAFT_559841 [Calocera viscosa TUFC12733]|uniref:DUF6533 domain-containing protein n=1 Tax=Calocera viscosa (strain TUFC12733) TaxID=1330018 RepID=A0A167RRY4_CALVF|nr:hypothetical protein CALVIDRAFT_559841 [Calocera viscosa TUFC12733]
MATILQALAQALAVAQYGDCVAGTLTAYDYILTFKQERDLIWKAKWTPVKALFLFIRYSVMLDMIGFFYIDFGQQVSDRSCTVVMNIVLANICTVNLCAALVIALRTWAIWERGRICGVIIGVAWSVIVVLAIYFTVYVIQGASEYEISDFAGFPGCGATNTPESLAAAQKSYMVLATYEGLIFLMTVIRGIRYLYRPSSLTFVLYRDAFLASTCLLTLTIVIAVSSALNSDFFHIPFMLSLALYSIAPCRIILNLRESASSLDRWDLSTTSTNQTHLNIPSEVALRQLDGAVEYAA